MLGKDLVIKRTIGRCFEVYDEAQIKIMISFISDNSIQSKYQILLRYMLPILSISHNASQTYRFHIFPLLKFIESARKSKNSN